MSKSANDYDDYGCAERNDYNDFPPATTIDFRKNFDYRLSTIDYHDYGDRVTHFFGNFSEKIVKKQ